MRWLLALALLAPAAAGAQPAPSTESLIRALRPTEENSDTRGVLRIGPQTAPPDPARQQATSRPEATLLVRFGFDSATLTPQATTMLDNLGRALSSPSLALYRFRLVGHTDGQGTEAYNDSLSQRRADTVREYLIKRWNVDTIRLVAEGRGFRELANPALPLDAANRRVQVINEGPAN